MAVLTCSLQVWSRYLNIVHYEDSTILSKAEFLIQLIDINIYIYVKYHFFLAKQLLLTRIINNDGLVQRLSNGYCLLKYGVGSNDSESKYYEELHCTCFNKRRLFSQTEYWSWLLIDANRLIHILAFKRSWDRHQYYLNFFFMWLSWHQLARRG